MTMNEWTEEAKRMNSKDRKKMLGALITLGRWPAFKREYGWTGFETLAYVLRMAEREEVNV
ncbi:MAG: hypothetical protein ABIJ57_13790 [Pseudomonadota bacterium]